MRGLLEHVRDEAHNYVRGSSDLPPPIRRDEIVECALFLPNLGLAPSAARLVAEFQKIVWHAVGRGLAESAGTKRERAELQRRFGELPDLSTPRAKREHDEYVRGLVAQLGQTAESILANLPERPKPPRELPPELGRTERDCLRAVSELQAKDVDAWPRSDEIAKRAIGSVKRGNVARPLANLVKLGLIRSREGPGGGYRITSKGAALLT